MPLGYHPKEGEVLKCDFSGFIVPEMVKGRWVVTVSPKYLNRGNLVTVVPLSTTPPNPIEKWHFKLTSALPHNEGDTVAVWAKCDMIFSASFTRLTPWWLDKSRIGKRVYIPVVLSKEELTAIKNCLLYSLGLGGLIKEGELPITGLD